MRTLVTGGVKSGKSSHALALAGAFGEPRYFLATAEAFDDEMKEKIARHKADRRGEFVTIEEPIAIHERLRDNMILDCVPLWLNNMFYYDREAEIEGTVDALIERMPGNIVIVTNEIGMGFVPADPLSRKYGNILGRVNARLATACDQVILMVSGIAFVIKNPYEA